MQTHSFTRVSRSGRVTGNTEVWGARVVMSVLPTIQPLIEWSALNGVLLSLTTALSEDLTAVGPRFGGVIRNPCAKGEMLCLRRGPGAQLASQIVAANECD